MFDLEGCHFCVRQGPRVRALTFLKWGPWWGRSWGSLHFRNALICGPYVLGIKAYFFILPTCYLAGTHGVGIFQKTKSSSAFVGNISKKSPQKAEELFYFVRVPPLKLQHTQPCLTENHHKKIKREISNEMTTNGIHSSLFPIPWKTSHGFDLI